VFAWALQYVDPERREQWVKDLDAPFPWEKTAVPSKDRPPPGWSDDDGFADLMGKVG